MNRAVIGVLIGLAWSACTVIDYLGSDCLLTKRCADGGVCPLTEAEAQERAAQGLDQVTFGSTDCEDLTCVRDPSYPKGADLTRQARGYCSRACSEGAPCNSTLRNDGPGLRCRPLQLEPPDAGAAAPFFCARGG